MSIVFPVEDKQPKTITFFSTLPITCNSIDNPDDCNMPFQITTISEFVIRVNVSGCSGTLNESDSGQSVFFPMSLWPFSYASVSFQISPVEDLFHLMGDRHGNLTIRIPELPDKTFNGETYKNIWSGYNVTKASR